MGSVVGGAGVRGWCTQRVCSCSAQASQGRHHTDQLNVRKAEGQWGGGGGGTGWPHLPAHHEGDPGHPRDPAQLHPAAHRRPGEGNTWEMVSGSYSTGPPRPTTAKGHPVCSGRRSPGLSEGRLPQGGTRGVSGWLKCVRVAEVCQGG